VDLSDPTTAALIVVEAFERASVSHALYGGLLLAAYGEPRETRDADVAVLQLSAADAATALRAMGVTTSIVFKDLRMGGVDVSRLTLLDAPGHAGLNTLGLVRPRSAWFGAAMMSRVVRAPLRGRPVPVLTPEDFVVMKTMSARDRDLDDAASVLRRTGSTLDGGAIERDVARLAEDHPELALVARYRAVVARASAGGQGAAS
jgi:hypothetical protein